MRGSASPQGEARRECAAKPERSDGRGREDYGWGWVGGYQTETPKSRSAWFNVTFLSVLALR